MVASLIRIDANLNKRRKYEWEKIDNGVYRIFGTIGIVEHSLDYLTWDGKNLYTRIEVIEREELFAPASMNTALGAPVTFGHTPRGTFDLNKDGLQVGSSLQEFRKDEDAGELDILFAIHDYRGVRLIDEELTAGRTPELSPTYHLKDIKLREDGRYAQIGRWYDSFALLREGEGRGGNRISLRTDGTDFPFPEGTAIAKYFFLDLGKREDKKEVLKVADLALRIDGKDEVFRDVDDKLATAVKGLVTRTDSLTSENEQLKTDLTTTQATLDATKIKLDEANTSLEAANKMRMDDNAIATELQKRGEIWDLVEPFFQEKAKGNGKEFRRDHKLGVADIQRLYIKLKAPHLNIDEKDDKYVGIIWDALAPQPGDEQKRVDEKKKQENISRVDTLYAYLNDKGVGSGHTNNEDLRTDEIDSARDAYAKRIENGKHN